MLSIVLLVSFLTILLDDAKENAMENVCCESKMIVMYEQRTKMYEQRCVYECMYEQCMYV